MAARHVTKDSWSRCEAPSMLYDARMPSRPLTKPDAASQVKNPDTIESTRDRLKKEMISKFDNKGLELPHESYVAVVQVGKYVFLAVMLPVYLCCYGIPRWFAVNALAPLFEGIKNQSINVGRHIVEISRRVTDLMKGLLDQLVGDSLRMAKERGKNLWRHVSRRFQRVSHKIAGFGGAIRARLGKVKGRIGDASKKVMERAHYQSKSTNEWIVEKTLKIAKRVGDKALNYFERFDRTFLTPFMRIITAPFRAVMAVVRFVKRQVLKVYNRIKRRLQKIYRPVAKVALTMMHYISGKIQARYQAIRHAFVKKMKAGVALLTQFKNALLKPLVWLANRYKILRPVFRVLKKAGALSFTVSKTTIKFAGKLLPKRAKVSNAKRGVIALLGRVFKAGVKRFFDPVVKLISKIKFGVIGIYKAVCWVLRHLSSLIKVLGRVLGRCLIEILKVLLFVAARIAFVVHVVIAVFWLSGTQGFQLTKQVSAPLKGIP